MSFATRVSHFVGYCAALLLVAGCSGQKEESFTARQAVIDYDLLLAMPEEPLSFEHDVAPVIDKRCVVCHGCFDAPCQLKLSSYEGISRGASPKKIYDGSRIRAAEPTRLFIDALSTAEWRDKNFSPVLNEGAPDPENNLENSVMYRMLRLKQLNPQPRTGMVPDSFDLSLDRKQFCADTESFGDYAKDYPLQGMPFAMPNLSDDEYDTLVTWLGQGAPYSGPKRASAKAATQIAIWENFLNGTTAKERLMSRYIYEHIFLSHIHFKGTDNREFYRLIRSRNPSGEPAVEIPSVRPYDDPGEGAFYYRIVRYQSSIVAKSHVVYRLSDQKLERLRSLFLEPDYTVASLPDYDPAKSANPFIVFREIPADSRYRFMLDDAKFYIEGFIKGPVCRGQVALNVIEDHFWVFFFDPDNVSKTDRSEFLDNVSNDLNIPSERGNTLNLLAIWTDYRKKQRSYIETRASYFEQNFSDALSLDEAMQAIWNGNGENRNAALTVFRDFDSANVVYGLLGDYPETAWVIDYPLLERIHYLLVAGFNVYGNVGHQLNTRLFMDFLRMEGEDYFLLLLPAADRQTIRQSWYVGTRARRAEMLEEPSELMATEVVKGYQTDDPQRELYQSLEQRLGTMAGPADYLNRCDSAECRDPALDASEQQVDLTLQKLASLKGRYLQAFPDVTFIRVLDATNTGEDRAYTLILNKSYKNLSSIFENEDDRDIDDDSLTIAKGLIGPYPNFFLAVPADALDDFVNRLITIESRNDYEQFVARFGIRRTNRRFWEHADYFQDAYAQQEPIESGILDLNRYENR